MITHGSLTRRSGWEFGCMSVRRGMTSHGDVDDGFHLCSVPWEIDYGKESRGPFQ